MRFTMLVVAIALLLAIPVILIQTWRPLIHGRLDPPSVAVEGMEPPLVARIREATDNVRASPYSAEAWGVLGTVFDAHDYLAEAVQCYERAHRLDTSDFRWLYFLGLCTFRVDVTAAIAHYEKAVALRPDYAPVEIRLGRGYFQTDDLTRAETHYRRAAELDPTLVKAHLGLGQVALGRGDAATALVPLERALGLGPSSGEVHWLMAEAYRLTGDAAAARVHRGQAGDGRAEEPLPDPVRQEWHWSAGVTLRWRSIRSKQYIAAGLVDQAIAEWSQAVSADPASADALLQLGLTCALAGRIDQAIPALERGLALEPGRHRARYQLGFLYMHRDRHREGIAALRQAAEALSDDGDVLLTLALALRTTSRYAEAEPVFRQAIAARPDHVGSRLEYGRMLGMARRVDDAIDVYRRITSDAPREPDGHAGLAQALQSTARYAEMVEALELGVTRCPDHVGLANRLAWVRATSADPALRDGWAAVALIDPFCARTGYRDPALLNTLAAAHAETGAYDESARLARAAIAILTAPNPPPGGTGSGTLLARLRERLASYERGRPVRE